MGLIRKGLFMTTGLVAPYSKKQKTQMQILAALQGATPEEIANTGTRSSFCSPPAKLQPQALNPAPTEEEAAEAMRRYQATQARQARKQQRS